MSKGPNLRLLVCVDYFALSATYGLNEKSNIRDARWLTEQFKARGMLHEKERCQNLEMLFTAD